MATEQRSIWALSALASVLAGAGAAVVAILARGHCARGHAMDGWWAVAFIGLALVPALTVGVGARATRRSWTEAALPLTLALCVGVILVFACLMIALSGQSCLR